MDRHFIGGQESLRVGVQNSRMRRDRLTLKRDDFIQPFNGSSFAVGSAESSLHMEGG